MTPRRALRAAMGALVALLALVTRAAPARAGGALEVHTSLDDVRACALAASGEVLAGTTGGVALFGADGKLEEVVTALDSLPDTRVHALAIEGDTVWIGTEGGLARATLRASRLSLNASFPAPPVRAIHRHAGVLYVGTWGGGVMRLADGPALARVAAARAGGAELARVTSLASFDGALVAGTAGAGLARLDAGGLAPYEVARAPRTIWSLAVHDGRLWIGGLDGAVSLAPAGAARFELDADTRALAADGGALFAGTFGEGLVRVAARDASTDGAHRENPGAFVQAVDARGGARCVGTRAGLFVDGARVGAGGPSDNDVTALARDGERLWVGTYDRGVDVLEAGRWRRVHSTDARVNALAVEPRAGGARVWVATARGLTVLDGDGASDVRPARSTPGDARTYGGGALPSGAVHAVAALSTGGVLVGTERGAAIVKDGAVTPIDAKRGLPVRAVWAVAEAPGGVLLLGTSAGLYAGPLGGPWQRASIASGHLKDDWVTSLLVHGRDVFVGTYNAGVTRLTLDGATLAPGEHLGGGYVNPAGLAIAQGTLYAATMDGLLARPLDGGAWASAGASTGRDVTAVVPAGRDLWIASRRGLVRARP